MDIAHIPPRVAAVIREVAEAHQVSVESLLIKSRRHGLDAARAEAMWRVRALYWPHMGRFRPSYPMIGRWFGRDHTSVINAVSKVSVENCLSPDDVAVDEAAFIVDRDPKRETMAA